MSEPQLEPARPPVAVSDADCQLLVRHRAGDAEAFPELVARFRARVYGYLVRCGVGLIARDDLFQEVFIRIHQSAAVYQPDRPLGPWVFRITANTVRSHFRKVRVRDAVAAEAVDLDYGDTAPDPLQLAEARETAAWMEQALQTLPLPQREAVVLCCLEDLPQEEAADVLGLPLNTLKTHLRRARLSLAQALARRNTRQRREVPL